MDGNDVWVRESGGGARLLHESFACSRQARKMSRQDFDRDIAIELNVTREVDDAHTTAANLTLKRIFSGECGLEIEEFAGGLRHAIVNMLYFSSFFSGRLRIKVL